MNGYKKWRLFWLLGLQLWSTSRASAQSSFLLINFQPPLVDAPVFDANGVPLEGPGYLAELWGAATPDALAPLVDVRFGTGRMFEPFLSGDLAGYFYSSEAFLSVPTVPPHGWAWLQVRAWDTSVGATYEEAVAAGIGGYGESPLFYAQGNDPLSVLPEAGAPLIGLQSFSLLPVVPEPSTWALLVIGGVGLLVALRRRPRGPRHRRPTPGHDRG